MSSPEEREKPLLADFQAEIRSLAAELREMLALRWELFRLEAASDLKSAARLLAVWLVAGVLLLTSLPLAVAALADRLAGVAHIARWGWLLIFAGVLFAAAVLWAFFAWRRFRRRFIGLQETLEELREDRVWLEEWLSAKNDEV